MNIKYFLLGDSIILEGTWDSFSEKDKQLIVNSILKDRKEILHEQQAKDTTIPSTTSGS
jgi:hypothetical protein